MGRPMEERLRLTAGGVDGKGPGPESVADGHGRPGLHTQHRGAGGRPFGQLGGVAGVGELGLLPPPLHRPHPHLQEACAGTAVGLSVHAERDLTLGGALRVQQGSSLHAGL